MVEELPRNTILIIDDIPIYLKKITEKSTKAQKEQMQNIIIQSRKRNYIL